jgi:hypothetical protein
MRNRALTSMVMCQLSPGKKGVNRELSQAAVVPHRRAGKRR